MKSNATFEVTKEWLESFSIEEDTADCSAGVLQLSDLIHFAEPDPGETAESGDQADLSQLAKFPATTWESIPAVEAKSR